MNVKRITRLIKLLQALSSGNGQNADGLAAECDVSRRTVFRDIDSLKEAGVPVAFDRDLDRYSIPGTHFLPPTNFTAEEALAVICLASQAESHEMPPFLEAARTAAMKLEASLPGELREQFRSFSRGIHLKPTSRAHLEGKQHVYQLLADAQASQRIVMIQYESLTEWETIETALRPYELLFARRSWYVIGRSSLHKEVRTFNLSRIAQATTLDEGFRRPKSFSLQRYLRNAWHMIPEPGPDSRVHLCFESLVAQNVAEVMWHKLQECEFREDGRLDFYVTVSGLNEISWWVLGYGDQVEVLEPLDLRKLVAQRLASAAKRYKK